ncbi:unnamed protein product [Schistocephalus solidus]|uniref:Uncharacterized protein n=1 Tax=Schistocephalus solidus TaxID=70667 RepID=A0A183SK20_SCHSO|nr:unnamed protein product [Schistocephalus solidus]
MECNAFKVFFLAFIVEYSFCEKLTPLLPGDPYNVIGDIESRQLGRCNYSYAWLAIPLGSNQDIYAHAAACGRLELQLLEFEADSQYSFHPRDIRSPQNARPPFASNVGEELGRVNKEYAAQLVDIQTLDALLQGVKVERGLQTNPPLVREDRLFYLSDRLGQFKMLAMLRPGRLPKIEVIPPPSQKAHLHPRHVLCYRKLCSEPLTTTTTTRPELAKQSVNSTSECILYLAQSKQDNRRLYTQVVIFRAVFALAAFLCLLFAIAALILCFRLRAVRRHCIKNSRIDQSRSYPPTQPSPAYYNMNGKLAFQTHSPLVFAEPGGGSINVAHMPSDTASLHNTAQSSNISGCELLTPVSPNGNAFPAYAYAQDGSGVLKLVQMPGHRTSVNGVQGMYLNRAVSPASSSQLEMRVADGYRAGSLDRRSDANSDTMQRRRTPIQVIPYTSGVETNFGNLQPLGYIPPTFKVAPNNDQTITSQGSMSTVIHQYPGEANFRFGQTSHGSVSGEAANATAN